MANDSISKGIASHVSPEVGAVTPGPRGPKELSSQEQITTLFQEFDKSRDGSVDASEMQVSCNGTKALLPSKR